MRPNFALLIATLPDERLEAFVKDWISRKTRDYVETERWSGPGDKGRDVVGYVTESRHEGDWDNFQCKQLSSRLSEKDAFVELGKIFMHAANGAYSLPRSYTFVAPKGVVRSIKDYIAHPERFRQAFFDNWDKFCAPNLVEKQTIPLTPEIADMIRKFAFKRVKSLDADGLADDPDAKVALVSWFGDDPGAAPEGQAPDTPLDEEAPYLGQLIGLYGERLNRLFDSFDDAVAHPTWGRHLRDQRKRYFDAAEFDRYYRDSTPPAYLATFKRELYDGVTDTYLGRHQDGLDRTLKVLTQAANVPCTGVLGRHARPSVKQGTCHQFANEGILPWKG